MSPRSTARRISPQMTGGTRVDSGSGRGAARCARRTAAGAIRSPMSAQSRRMRSSRVGTSSSRTASMFSWISRSRAAGSASAAEPRALELQQDHLVDRQGHLSWHRAPGRADEGRQGGPHAANVGAPVPATPDLVGDERPHRVPESLAHRPRRVHQGVGPAEQLVGRLEQPQRLVELAVAGRAAAQHVEREAQGSEVTAPRAVPDLRAVEDGALQDFDRRAVLLEVLRREIVEMDLDDGHETGQGLGYLLGRPQ